MNQNVEMLKRLFKKEYHEGLTYDSMTSKEKAVWHDARYGLIVERDYWCWQPCLAQSMINKHSEAKFINHISPRLLHPDKGLTTAKVELMETVVCIRWYERYDNHDDFYLKPLSPRMQPEWYSMRLFTHKLGECPACEYREWEDPRDTRVDSLRLL